MNKFNVGDILRSKEPNFSDNKYIYVIIADWQESNEHHTPVYKIISINTGFQYTWNANHVECHYERVS